ncbi:NAD(P)-binding protein [Serendipita vermifera]|nr:NAD(P)-binding protein [Serendipita vermifera]
MPFVKVAQIGATGNVGTPIFNALAGSNKFDLTVVARPESKFVAPEGVKLVRANFDNHDEVVAALKGNEAVVITVGRSAGDLFTAQKKLIDAAIDAGVQRIIPSHFGGDTESASSGTQMMYAAQIKVINYVKEKAAEGKITWTSVMTGPWLDFGLQTGLLGFKVKDRKITLFDGGSRKHNFTLLPTIGQAVISILAAPEPAQFANKALRIHDFYVSQTEILAILEEELAKRQDGTSFETEDVSTVEIGSKAREALLRGENNIQNVMAMLRFDLFGAESSAAWGSEDDNGSLEIQEKGTEELREVLKKAF